MLNAGAGRSKRSRWEAAAVGADVVELGYVRRQIARLIADGVVRVAST
jgi:hypothetical protein